MAWWNWNQLQSELQKLQATVNPQGLPHLQSQVFQAQVKLLETELNSGLKDLSGLRGGTNVILYGSAFLQKPAIPSYAIAITPEDLNGLMSVIHGMDWSKGLTLILHTPGGDINATATVVSYLRSKFEYIEVIIPAMAMSAGTMISLSADKIVMGRQSQLGPIDPQLPLPSGASISANAVREQFERAKKDVVQDRATAHVWAPILQTIGPTLLQDAENALRYSEKMVAGWLAAGMFKNKSPSTRTRSSNNVAKYFNNAAHLSHGKRIDRDEARAKGLAVDDLESHQDLQDATLSAYYLVTQVFQLTPTAKVLWNHDGTYWAKPWVDPSQAQQA